MPGHLNGRELAAELRVHRADLPILFISGYSPDAADHETSWSEHEHFVPKPSSPAALLEAVRRCLDGPH